MMRIHCTRYLVQNLKSSSFQNAVKHCLGNSETALFSTSISLQRKDSSGLRSNPKIDELFPNVVDFPNRHIGPRKCIFPFTHDGKTYHGCPIEPDDPTKRWCSTLVDKAGHHVVGKNKYGHCSENCPSHRQSSTGNVLDR